MLLPSKMVGLRRLRCLLQSLAPVYGGGWVEIGEGSGLCTRTVSFPVEFSTEVVACLFQPAPRPPDIHSNARILLELPRELSKRRI